MYYLSIFYFAQGRKLSQVSQLTAEMASTDVPKLSNEENSPSLAEKTFMLLQQLFSTMNSLETAATLLSYDYLGALRL